MSHLKKLFIALAFIAGLPIQGVAEDLRFLGEIADESTTGDIESAMTLVKSWWVLHRGGFPQQRLLMPDAVWRKPYAVPGLKVSTEWKALCAWSPDRTEVWWAVPGDRNRWTIYTGTISWTIKVTPKSRTPELVEVRFKYPVLSEPAFHGGTTNQPPQPPHPMGG